MYGGSGKLILESDCTDVGVGPSGFEPPIPLSLSNIFASSTLLLLTLDVRLDDISQPSLLCGRGVLSGVVVSLFTFLGVPQ